MTLVRPCGDYALSCVCFPPIADIRDKEAARKPYRTNLNVAFVRGGWAVAASSLEFPGLPIAVDACRCKDHLLSKA